jgi:hypothetical protein
MLILPPGHAQAIGQPRPFRAREKGMIGGVLVAVVALAVALIISLGSSTPKSGHGCISVALAYSTGGAQVYRCGGSAREMCAGVGRPGGITGATARSVSTECRKAGLPTG